MLRVRKFRSIDELEMFLNGALVGKGIGDGVYNLVGKTLIFSQPAAATCTFATGSDLKQQDPKALSRKEIKSQLEAAVAGLTVRFLDGKIVLIQTTPTVGQGVIITGGTGRDELGFAEDSGSTGKVYNPPSGTDPKMISVHGTGDGPHVLVTSE